MSCRREAFVSVNSAPEGLSHFHTGQLIARRLVLLLVLVLSVPKELTTRCLADEYETRVR
jgi:hypothetical protein